MVAALADPTMQLVEAAAGRQALTGTDEALAARILELDGERLRFTHPLLAPRSAAVKRPFRSLHARLAQRVPTEEERARHLALATAEPSSEIAAALEDAARAAAERRSHHCRGAAAEQALRLTPPQPAPMPAGACSSPPTSTTPSATAPEPRPCSHARGEAARGVELAGVLVQLAAAQSEPRRPQAPHEQALAEAQGTASRRQSTSGSLPCAGGRECRAVWPTPTSPSGPPPGPTTSRSDAARSRSTRTGS